MSSSDAVMPSASISRQANDLLAVPVAKPGMV